jgi:glutathione S-transferase
MNRLITIPISHYCEKARWALKLGNIPYKEEPHLQLFHLIYVKLAGGGDTAPLLVTPDGPLNDSTDILKWVDSKLPEDRKLYPADVRIEVEELEDYLDEGLGVAGRLWMYTYMLHQLPTIIKYSKTHGVPLHERLLMPIIFPLGRSRINGILGLTSTSREDSQRDVDKAFDKIASRLSDGRKFLIGNKFTAADLTFACLSAAVLLPENYGVALPALSELPSEMTTQIMKWRNHPAGKFAMRLWGEKGAVDPLPNT